MFSRTITDDHLRRLQQERDEADRRYNEALTALDKALVPPSGTGLPGPPSPFDEQQITPLNRLWNILPAEPPAGSGWRGRLAGAIWRAVAPMFQRQQEFNSALVDHVNRNVALHRDTQRAVEATMASLGSHVDAMIAFQSSLILYLQQITGYVDTKDRALIGGVSHELEQRTIGLAAGLSGVGDELLKRWDMLGTLQQATLALKRELERRETRTAGPAATAAAPTQTGNGVNRGLDAYKYVGFEDRYRGSREEIRARLSAYVPSFEGTRDVLDVGCGRGEFLELLRERGIAARGIDLNAEMVERCRQAGLDAQEADALEYLSAIDDGSLGGLLAAQVVEHLRPDYLMRFLETAYHKLRPGSHIVLETINPACWAAFFSAYLRDITHAQPLHPDTLKYLLTASGFARAEVCFSSPYPEPAKLQPVPSSLGLTPELSRVIETFNANVDKVNSLLFTYTDYAAIGQRI